GNALRDNNSDGYFIKPDHVVALSHDPVITTDGQHTPTGRTVSADSCHSRFIKCNQRTDETKKRMPEPTYLFLIIFIQCNQIKTGAEEVFLAVKNNSFHSGISACFD